MLSDLKSRHHPFTLHLAAAFDTDISEYFDQNHCGNRMLRKYKEGDRDDLIAVWFAASKIATPFLSDEFLAAERDNIAEIYLPNAETWIFEIEDALVGFTSLIGNEVGALFVRPDLHGKGIGTTLMDHAVELRKSVFLDVFKENTLGRRFYDRYGFQIEREHVHDDTGHSLLRLVYSR